MATSQPVLSVDIYSYRCLTDHPVCLPQKKKDHPDWTFPDFKEEFQIHFFFASAGDLAIQGFFLFPLLNENIARYASTKFQCGHPHISAN